MHSQTPHWYCCPFTNKIIMSACGLQISEWLHKFPKNTSVRLKRHIWRDTLWLYSKVKSEDRSTQTTLNFLILGYVILMLISIPPIFADPTNSGFGGLNDWISIVFQLFATRALKARVGTIDTAVVVWSFWSANCDLCSFKGSVSRVRQLMQI